MATNLRWETKLADIVPTLNKPEAYLRGVLDNMIQCRREHGVAYVSIGVTGTGKAPHYRVGPGWGTHFEDIESRKDLSPYFKAYHGGSHKPIDRWGEGELEVMHWSTEEATIEEVRRLLGEVRGFKRGAS